MEGEYITNDYINNKDPEWLIKIIQQLWICIRRKYTYEESKLHIRAYSDGYTTERKIVVVEREDTNE